MGSFFDIIYEPAIRLGDPYPLFTRVSLETTSQCTRRCSFCPVGLRDPRVESMSDALFSSIISQLGELEFDGVIQWFYVNESLYDRAVLFRLRRARAAMPRVTIHLTTNGDLLGRVKWLAGDIVSDIDALFDAGVNSLNVNAYDQDAYDRLAPLLLERSDGEHCWKRIGPKKRYLSFSDMRDPAGLHTWNDTVDIDPNKKCRARGSRCARPHRHLVIMWNGIVPLCCAIAPHQATPMADANRVTLLEAWNSRAMNEYRWRLQNGIRENECHGCIENMAFPHVVRDVSDDFKPRNETCDC